MTPDSAASILRGLGVPNIRISRNGKVQCSCPVALWTHSRGTDSRPSGVVLFGDGGQARYVCAACHWSASLRNLVLTLMSRTGTNLFDLVDAIDAQTEWSGKPTKLSERLALVQSPDRVAASRIGSVAMRMTTDDGKPWFDYKCIHKASLVEEIEAKRYEPYRHRVPRYALDRHLTVETCKEWDLGYDQDWHRLLFPVRDRQQRLVGISGRLIDNICPKCRVAYAGAPGDRPQCPSCEKFQPPKYLHSNGFDRNLFVFGEHRVGDGRGKVYVVEGHLDCLWLWQQGYRPVVALFGSYPGPAQIEKIIAYWDSVVAVGDGDIAGRDMAGRVKAMVADRIPVVAKICPSGRDPGGGESVPPLSAEELAEFLGPPPLATNQLTNCVTDP